MRLDFHTLTSSLVLASLAALPVGCGYDIHNDMSTMTDSDAATEGSSEPSESSESSGEMTGVADCGGPCGDTEVCVATQCVDVNRPAIEGGCHPFADGQCMYPWPSNVYTRADGGTATGLRLDYDAALIPTNVNDDPFPVALTNELDGFSPNSQIRFVTPFGVAGEQLPGINDIEGSMADDSPIVLLDVDTGERWPFFAEVDVRASSTASQAVFVRPMWRLEWGHRYVVALRGLTDSEGAFMPSPPLFAALRDGQPTDFDRVEGMRPGYEELFAALEQAGVERADLQLAWDFTTVSHGLIQDPGVEAITSAKPMMENGDLGFNVHDVEVVEDDELRYIISGKYLVPNCMTADAGPGERLRRDGDGHVFCEGTVEAPFTAAVPKSVVDSGAPVPVLLWGHGLLGEGSSAVGVADKIGDHILVGTDFWGLSTEDIPNVLALFSKNFDNGASPPERLIQSVINFSALGYMVVGDEFAAIPELQGLVDQSAPVQYIGGSQGGIMGGTVVGLAPNLNRGVLVVGGSNYSLMVWRSTAFFEVESAWSISQGDVLEREFLFALYQSMFDYADPLTFDNLIETPLYDGPEKRLLLVEALGDCQVPNIASELLARTYGMKMLDTPVYPVYGVPGTTDPVDGHAMLQVDTLDRPLPPIENIPPEDDNGAHGNAVDGPAAQQTVEQFYYGPVANQCDGMCDPN